MGKRLRQLVYDRHGSYTIEVSMVFTIVLLAVLAVVFSFSYMLQRVSVTRLAAAAARQGAELWKQEGQLYYRVNDNMLFGSKTIEFSVDNMGDPARGAGLPEKKLSSTGNIAYKNLRSLVLKPKNTDIRVSYSNNLLKGQLTVEVMQEINIPIGGIKAFFGGKNTVPLRGKASSTVVEPSEYIRNIDLAVELSKRLQESISLEDIMGRISGNREKE